MLDYRDILNKYYVVKLSAREISRQTGMSKSGVQKFIQAFEKCDELSYPLPPGITNAGIALKVYGKVPGEEGRDESYEYPDYQQVLKLMNERKNMTLQVCWDRYIRRCKAEEKKSYQYRQFCELLGKWCEENYETAHFTAVIAQTMEVDFAGKTFDLIDRLTGEVRPIVVFVAVKKKEHCRSYYWDAEKEERMPLPSTQYHYMERATAKVSSDFHVRFDNAYYSVDKEYLHKEVERAFSLGKRCYGMGLIRTKREDITLASIALSVFVMNLFKIHRRIFYTLFYQLRFFNVQGAWAVALVA